MCLLRKETGKHFQTKYSWKKPQHIHQEKAKYNIFPVPETYYKTEFKFAFPWLYRIYFIQPSITASLEAGVFIPRKDRFHSEKQSNPQRPHFLLVRTAPKEKPQCCDQRPLITLTLGLALPDTDQRH